MPSLSIATALRVLRTEETRIQRELDAVRGQLQRLNGASGRGKGKRGPGRPKGASPRRMSAAGRAAISRAAKKRWAAWRKTKAGKRF
jgi:hypothetical protein